MNCYLLSYPRSGVTWFRYCLEVMTGRPTLGSTAEDPGIYSRDGVELDVDPDSDFLACKRHSWGRVDIDEGGTLILLLRNPVEVMSRRHVKEGHGMDKVLNENIPHYAENIAKFDQFGGEKYVVYYEDIIKDEPLRAALEGFLDVFEDADEERLSSLMEDIDHHRQVSLESYPQTYSRGQSETYYDNEVNDHKRREFAEHVKEELPKDFIRRYLSRYDEVS